MSRIRDGRTCGFHCNLCICNLYKVPRFGGPVFSSVLSRKTNLSSSNSMSRIREGRTCRFHCNLYIYNPYKMPRLGGVVQFSVVLWVGKLILVVWTACRESEKVAHGDFIVICIQLFRERLSKKSVHETIPKGNMGYDHYTVPNDCNCRTYFWCFPLALANMYMSMASRAILSNFFEEQHPQNHPQYLSVLSLALFPTTFLEISVYLCLYKMPRCGGPVFSGALSRKTNFSSLNSMSRIQEGRTWRFHCNLYICNLTSFLKIKYIWDNKFSDEHFVYPFVVKCPPLFP